MMKWFERNLWASWTILIITAGYILYISSLTKDPTQIIMFPYKSIIYHFGIFMLLTFFSMISFSKGGKRRDYIFVGILFSMLYAVSDEFHQVFIAGRSASLGDLLTDSIGIILAGISYLNRHKKAIKK